MLQLEDGVGERIERGDLTLMSAAASLSHASESIDLRVSGDSDGVGAAAITAAAGIDGAGKTMRKDLHRSSKEATERSASLAASSDFATLIVFII